MADNSAFISYRRGDGYPWARLIWDELHNRSVNVFLDLESMRQAGRFDVRILNQIAARPYFLVVLTEGSLDRCASETDWMRREIEHAIGTDRVIVPLFIAPFETSHFPPDLAPHIAETLANSNGVTFYSQFLEAALDQLVDFLQPVDVHTADLSEDDAEFEQRAVASVRSEPAPTLPPPVIEQAGEPADTGTEPDRVPPPPPPPGGSRRTLADAEGRLVAPGEAAIDESDHHGVDVDGGGDGAGRAGVVDADVGVDGGAARAGEADADHEVDVGGAGGSPTGRLDEHGREHRGDQLVDDAADSAADGDAQRSASALATEGRDSDADAGAVSSPSTREVTEAGHGRSTRSRGPVDDVPADQPSTGVRTDHGGGGGARRWRRILVLSGVAIVIAAGVVGGWYLLAGDESSASTLTADEWLESGDSIVDGDAELTMVPDGRLDLTFRGESLDWPGGGPHERGAAAVFQRDGNFVVYPFKSDVEGLVRHDGIWATSTQGRGGTEFRITDTGSTALLTIRRDDGEPVWEAVGRSFGG